MRFNELTDHADTAPWGRGLGGWFSPWDWEHLQREVEEESRARILIIGAKGVGKSTLFNGMSGWDVSALEGEAAGTDGTGEEDFGTFCLIDLPLGGDGPTLLPPEYDPSWGSPGPPMGLAGTLGHAAGGFWAAGDVADLVVFVVDGTRPLDPAEYRWFSQLRAAGRPLVVVVNKTDLLDGRTDEVCHALERRLACPVVAISAHTGANVERVLLPRMVDSNPALAVPIGRELACARRLAASRVIQRAALLCTAVGCEPIPLLDIPFQLATQMKLLIRLAALYAKPGSADMSRGILASAAGGLAIRLGVQQASKLVPVAGWIVSGLLSGLTTCMLGRVAIAHLEGRLPGRRVWHFGRRWHDAATAWQAHIGQHGRLVRRPHWSRASFSFRVPRRRPRIEQRGRQRWAAIEPAPLTRSNGHRRQA
jgi:uncharacterized protein (DUF697 family)/GTP-binding protein EngB required for normal cell division